MIASAGAFNQYKSDEALPISKEESTERSGNKSSKAEYASPETNLTKQPENFVTEDSEAPLQTAATAPAEPLR